LENKQNPGVKPSGPVRIYMYNVGFGDCLLLRFPYAEADGGDRHVLLDIGTTKRPKGATRNWMKKIAEDIQNKCDGELDAVVVTHRHKDHLGGLAGSSGDIIASLKPKLVVEPWTEDPMAPPDAQEPPENQRESMHYHGLLAAQEFVKATLDNLERLVSRSGKQRAVAEDIGAYGQENLPNKEAIDNLQTMGSDGRADYVHYGFRTRLEEILPGVSVKVLGPPTLTQTDEIRAQRGTDPEYWHLYAAVTETLRSAEARSSLFDFPYMSPEDAPHHARWVVEQIDLVSLEQLRAIVRILDAYLNNTSVILLFEVNGKRFLFPGDAQIENWEYAMSQPESEALLSKVDVYKVGHHGSLNGTPKTLWRWFEKKSQDQQEGRLVTLLSTREGKHGHSDRGTEVPREKLVDELTRNSKLITTEKYPDGVLCQEFQF
jgi:hypothetical protein